MFDKRDIEREEYLRKKQAKISGRDLPDLNLVLRRATLGIRLMNWGVPYVIRNFIVKVMPDFLLPKADIL